MTADPSEFMPSPCGCPAATPVRIVGERTVTGPSDLDGCRREAFRLHSPGMGRDINVAVLTPPDYARDDARRFPILYALHGRGAPYLCWTEMAPLRRALAEMPALVVVFNGDSDGCYVDAVRRPRSLFQTFFFRELLPFVESTWRADPSRRAVTGFSMGGAGAAGYLVERPDLFASVSCLSSGLDLTVSWTDGDVPRGILNPLLGSCAENEAAHRRASVFERLRILRDAGTKLPPIFLACGTEDHCLPGARRARDFLARQGIAAEYLESPGGHHWPYWRDISPRVLEFHWRTFNRPESPA